MEHTARRLEGCGQIRPDDEEGGARMRGEAERRVGEEQLVGWGSDAHDLVGQWSANRQVEAADVAALGAGVANDDRSEQLVVGRGAHDRDGCGEHRSRARQRYRVRVRVLAKGRAEHGAANECQAGKYQRHPHGTPRCGAATAAGLGLWHGGAPPGRSSLDPELEARLGTTMATVPPPVLLPAGVVAALGLEWLCRTQAPLRHWVAGGMLAAGAGLAGSAIATMTARGTSPDPRHEVHSLVVEGPYRWVRNPIYLGMVLAQLGVGLGTRQRTVAYGALLAGILFDQLVVPQEEARLRARFGEAYDAYAATTPRWLGRRSRGA